MVSVEMLHRLMICDAESGNLWWRERTPDLFDDGIYSAERKCLSWNKRFAMQPAITAFRSNGYLHGHVLSDKVSAHRVIWAMTHGEWPANQIDHINGNPSDNRICNLRIATQAQNNANARKRRGKSSTSQYIGVSWSNKERKWVASMRMDGRNRRIGAFTCETSAALARDNAALGLRGEFARLNFPQLATGAATVLEAREVAAW